MKRAFKNFILLLITISIFPNAVNGASIGSGPGDCSISNAYYDSDVFVNASGFGSTNQKLIYDIVNVDLYNDVLYLYGWAFNNRVSTSLGSNAKVEFVLHPQDGKGEDVPFAVDYASPGNASCMGNGCGGNGGSPKYYDLTYWNCNRTSRGGTINVNGSNVETGGYCMAGETNSPRLTGGFRAMIDLTLDKIEPDKTYVVKMKFTHSDPRSHISSNWVEVAAAQAVVFDRVLDYNGTDGKQISISGFKETAQVIASMARPTGKNGLYCSSSIASSSGLEAASSTHYAQTSGFPIKDERGSTQWACRGGSSNCPNGATNGAGSIRLYELYYNKRGNQAVPASGAGGTSAYAPASWLKFDGNITISTTKEEDPEDPEIPAPVECEGGEIYKFYYFFLAGVSDGWFGKSDTKRMITSADANNFDDKEILQMLGFTSNSEIKKAGGIYPINKDNLSWYYEKLKSAQSGANRWSADGDGKTFYITYNSWCTAGTNGETKCYDANTGCELDKNGNKTNVCNPNEIASSSFDTNEYIKATINVAVSNDKKDSLIITPQDAKAGLGYQFGISRFFKKYPNGYPSMANPGTKATPTKSNKHYLHPAVYQLTFCKTEEPQCDDTVNAAECPGGDTGVEFVFNEHDDKTACTLEHGTESGFTIIEKEETLNYCTVACKEDLHGYLPGSKETAAGQYFLLDLGIKDYVPKIEAKRTCVTSEIKYDDFDKDLKKYEKESAMPLQYNDYQDFLDIYETLDGEITDEGTLECEYVCGIDPVTGDNKYCPGTYDYQDWVLYSHDAVNKGGLHDNSYPGDSDHYEVSAQCDNHNTGTDYDTAYNTTKEEYRKKTDNAKGIFERSMYNYKTIINAYNACFTWTDIAKDASLSGGGGLTSTYSISTHDVTLRDYYFYRFEPTVEFDYGYSYDEKDRLRIFSSPPYRYDYYNGKDVLPAGGPDAARETSNVYWTKNATTDNKYEQGGSGTNGVQSRGLNFEHRTLLNCVLGNKTCTPSTTIDTSFYTSAYVRRDEEITYEYHLPQVYTTIPDGVVFSDDKPSTSTKPFLILDPEAVPVNINTQSGTYDYKLSIRDIKDPLRNGKIKPSITQNNKDDTFDTRFSQKALTAGDDYVCTYDVINDIYLPGPERFNFFYRVVDPFEINPLGRTLGYNWTDGRGDEVQNWMREDASDYQTLTNSSTRDKFEFTFTPLAMQEIRRYNALQNVTDDGYADWDLSCDDYDKGGYHCRSNFLSCLASGGDDRAREQDINISCSEIFENSLTNYSKLSKYGWSELEANRRLIINKQNDIDCRNGNIQEACGEGGR